MVFDRNSYKPLVSDYDEEPAVDPEIFNYLKKVIIPETCDRCLKNRPRIRVFDKISGTIEFICVDCRNADSKINKIEIKR